MKNNALIYNQIANTVCHVQVSQKMPHSCYVHFKIEMHFVLSSHDVFQDYTLSLNSNIF